VLLAAGAASGIKSNTLSHSVIPAKAGTPLFTSTSAGPRLEAVTVTGRGKIHSSRPKIPIVDDVNYQGADFTPKDVPISCLSRHIRSSCRGNRVKNAITKALIGKRFMFLGIVSRETLGYETVIRENSPPWHRIKAKFPAITGPQ
jgi:hypothetical protein